MKSAGAQPLAGDDSTRQRVLSAILTHGPLTAAALADNLGLTAAAIRRHLEALVSDGALEPVLVNRRGPRGRGRPAKMFVLTESGRARFHNSYSDIALQAIAELVRAVGPSGLDRLAEAFFGPTGAEFTTARAEHPSESAAVALAAALDDGGFVASVDKLPSGEQLLQHHCPVADIARAYPQLCEIETQFIARLLDSHVQRLATIAHGDGVCTTHIPKPVAADKTLGNPQQISGRNQSTAKVEMV
ncbi:MAG: helix-turn-helix domain-containing protein [Propionibacteriaceae bacterium]|nr:helix-turn-helix domain-containing protein [Propionibacteriaceae bacterium]